MTNSNQTAHRLRSKLIASIAVLVATTVAVGGVGVRLSAAERPRLLLLTDIGGDPDDQQSMVRLMLYSNEFDIEGLVASASGTPGELKRAVTRPDLIRTVALKKATRRRGSSSCRVAATIRPIRRDPAGAANIESRPKAGITRIDPPARTLANRSAAGGRTSSKTSPAACRGAGNGSRVG